MEKCAYLQFIYVKYHIFRYLDHLVSMVGALNEGLIVDVTLFLK
jgi:hypothetical protein